VKALLALVLMIAHTGALRRYIRKTYKTNNANIGILASLREPIWGSEGCFWGYFEVYDYCRF